MLLWYYIRIIRVSFVQVIALMAMNMTQSYDIEKIMFSFLFGKHTNEMT